VAAAQGEYALDARFLERARGELAAVDGGHGATSMPGWGTDGITAPSEGSNGAPMVRDEASESWPQQAAHATAEQPDPRDPAALPRELVSG
jgi:hypothetical protein